MSKNAASRRNQKHRPNSLGLTQFAAAKTSTYDKQARKQKERALNSKIVNKYRKLKARLEDASAENSGYSKRNESQESGHDSMQPATLHQEGVQDTVRQTGRDERRVKHKKPAHQIQRIYAAKEKEKAMHLELRHTAQQEAETQVAKRAQAFQKRKQHSTQMRKKTRSGQPVMKVRIGKMLEQLQEEKS